MAFALRPDQPVARETHRVLRDQVDHGVDALASGASEDAVHRARKAIKRARAVLVIVRRRLPREPARDVRRELRAAAHALAPVREHDVAARRLHALGRPMPDPTDRCEPVRRALGHLQRAAAGIDRLDTSRVDADAWAAGLRRAWRVSRAAFQVADDDPTPARLHAWRKAAKRLLVGLELTSARHPALSPLVALLDALQEPLGEHHDLSLWLASVVLDPDHRARLDAERSALERQTLTLGGWLFAGRARAFGRWVDALPSGGSARR